MRSVRAGRCRSVAPRRACRVLRTDTSTYHYKSKRASQAGLTRRIKEIAETRGRYGYRRIHVLLRRKGWTVNAKRIYRLYKGLGLQLRNKTPKRRSGRSFGMIGARQCRPTKRGRWTSRTISLPPAGRSGC